MARSICGENVLYKFEAQYSARKEYKKKPVTFTNSIRLFCNTNCFLVMFLRDCPQVLFVLIYHQGTWKLIEYVKDKGMTYDE